MPSFRALSPLPFVLAPVVALFGVGCTDTEYISVGGPPPASNPVGEACTVDADCSTGRCIGGVCADTGCQTDEDCRDDEICVLLGDVGNCEPRADFECTGDTRPILSISTTSVTFDQVALGSSESRTVTVTNLGQCLLNIAAVGLAENSSDDFDCSPCSVASRSVPPNRSLDITVTYAPTRPGEANGELQLRSDDITAGPDGVVTVDLFARYDGIPSVVVDPLELNYGFVPFSAGGGGGVRTETVTITNRGTGSAVLAIENLFIDNGEAFTITALRQGDSLLDVDAIANDNPILVPPYSVDNPLAAVEVDVAFQPTANREYTCTPPNRSCDRLVIRTDGVSDNQRVVVVLSGSSLGPPQIEVSAAEFVYGAPGTDALAIGSVDFRQVTIRNNGQSDLIITPAIGGGSAAADFNVMPTFVPPISPGGAIILSVFYNPSGPSDPANTFSPQRPVEAVLNITSNDTDPGSDVLKTVALRGYARSGVQDQVLKVEMEYENADNSWAGSDFRNVDLIVESVDGAVTCSKPQYLDLNRNGTFGEPGEYNDLCADWTASGAYGQASWLALGSFEEPERVVVRGMGPTGANGEEFDVKVTYIEDCANIPSGLLADILGIGGSILLGALGGSIGVPIAVDPNAISNTIANNCFDHAGSTTTTRISLDGAVVASPSVRLNAKGDTRSVARLRRVNGAFCSLTAGVGDTSLQCQ
ncbi:MAG: choice-of-anchor D domain-containing protein [Deltaproteobacteria bacterium]|nr:choice-of-anchor D domain-containing protein [Deltaproteobacteria bacterium]